MHRQQENRTCSLLEVVTLIHFESTIIATAFTYSWWTEMVEGNFVANLQWTHIDIILKCNVEGM